MGIYWVYYPFKGLLGGLKQLGYHPRVPAFSLWMMPRTQPFVVFCWEDWTPKNDSGQLIPEGNHHIMLEPQVQCHPPWNEQQKPLKIGQKEAPKREAGSSPNHQFSGAKLLSVCRQGSCYSLSFCTKKAGLDGGYDLTTFLVCRLLF